VTSASHVERDDVKGLTYDFTMDFTARLKGMYHLFCIPDDVHQEPYLLAKIQDDPCYIHRYIACAGVYPLCQQLATELTVLVYLRRYKINCWAAEMTPNLSLNVVWHDVRC